MRREVLAQWAGKLTASLRQHRAVWLVLLAGLVLLAVPTGERLSADRAEPTPAGFDLAATEDRLSRVLSRIDGAGEVTVVLTVRSGTRQVLAEDVDRDEGSERTQTVVLSRSGSGQQTVTVQEVYPAYQGALLVCSGGDDPTVRLRLTEAMTALTGLGADKISISKGK